MGIENLLHDEIQEDFEKLRRVNFGSEEYKTGVDGLAKLLDRAIELDKLNTEDQDKTESRENEERWKQIQHEEEKKDRWVKHGISVAGIVLPILVTIWGTKASFKFEETGTVTTMMGRGFINKLLPKK